MLRCGEVLLFFLFLNVSLIFTQEFRLQAYTADRPLPFLGQYSFINRYEQNITLKNCSLEKISLEAFKNVKVQKLIILENPLRILRRRVFSLVMADEVYLDQNQIDTIEPGTFHYVQPLYEDSMSILSLTYNNLQTIKRGVFSGTNFRKLLLNSNKIDYLELGAFENMPYLLALHLGDNLLQTIDVGVFNNLPNPIMLRLSNNTMSFIHPRAFENSTIFSLDLQNNNLGEVQKEYFSNAQIGWIFV